MAGARVNFSKEQGDCLKEELHSFREFGRATFCSHTSIHELNLEVETFTNEFWTSAQRAAHSLHEISYRACFKPQLPRFFIDRLTSPGDVVYDPFMGRGTTLLEAALAGRVPAGCDVNPLSRFLLEPRLNPPEYPEIEARLLSLELNYRGAIPEELLVFYHEETLRELCALREYFLSHELDRIDSWLRMVALNRLTGHSSGFFSVYTLPPNQAVTVESQRRINEKRGQVPPQRDVKRIMLKKTKSLLKDCVPSGCRRLPGEGAPWILTASSEATPQIPDESVSLVVTSPPFLDVVDYEQDNWLRSWFAGIDPKSVHITMEKGLAGWRKAMSAVFRELGRIVKHGGYVAFEVGEVRHGSVYLEEQTVPCGVAAGFTPELILINSQQFTKTANCWGVDNNSKGTNTNRIVLFRKD